MIFVLPAMRQHAWLCFSWRFAGAIFLVALFGCDVPLTHTPGVSPEILAKGRAVYNFRCYFCHGYSGDAKTLAASYITPPPRDFTKETPDSLAYAQILNAVINGREGTGMKSFAQVIPRSEQEAVAAFVFDEFVVRKASNTRYHTAENGWDRHERYRAAFPFATGEIDLVTPPEQLSTEQRHGRELYMSTCISCHDRGKPVENSPLWESRPLSYPRNNYDHRKPEVDASTSATPYRLHDVLPPLAHTSAKQKRGEKLYQDNCAFCHAADGTGKNWIGSFLEPHPRNLTDANFMRDMTHERLKARIQEGIKDSSMPAWKSVLSEDEIEAIISYIDIAFHPVGK